jgi:predicted dehydrogenase
MAATWGWDEISTDWRSVIGRSDIDVIDVATPNSLHAEMAIAAAAAGKIVLCEKPLAVSPAQARQMSDAVRGVPNMVWFNYRRVPAIAFTRRLVDEGRIGQVFHYRATYLQEWGNDPTRPPGWKLQKSDAGSGVLGDLLSHLVDTALYLNGPIAEVSAMMHTFAPGRDVDDATLLLARFANGSIGSFEATRYAVGCRNRNSFEIHGSKGMARFDLEDLNRLEFFDAADARNLQRRAPSTGDGTRSALLQQLLEARPHHRVRAHLHRRAGRFSAIARNGRALPSEFRGRTSCRTGAGRCGSVVEAERNFHRD